jgi:hypothetical protein
LAGAVNRATPQQIETVVSPVYLAYAKAQSAQAVLPPPTSDSERLIRLGAIDQAGRDVLSDVIRSMANLSAEDTKVVWPAIWAEITPHDEADQRALVNMLPAKGWFRISVYGTPAAKAAFLIVQHSTDQAFQESVLERMKPLIGTADLDGQAYGLLWDRIALKNNRPQRYGSQVDCVGGGWQPTNLEDPAHVDERRKQLGFKETEEKYLARFAHEPCR